MDKYWQPKSIELTYHTGMVESYFLKLNEPTGKWAVWIKYTYLLRNLRHHPIGDCWVIFFDREGRTGQPISAWKESYDIQGTASARASEISFGPNLLTQGISSGFLNGGGVQWKISFTPETPPLALLPGVFYSSAMPTSKLTSPYPLAQASGELSIGDHTYSFDRYPLLLGHNWGRKHTRSYVWGQAQKKTHDGLFLFEGCSLPVEFSDGPAAPAADPQLSVARVRLGEHSYDFNGPGSWLKNKAQAALGEWRFQFANRGHRLSGEITWDHDLVVGLRYIQPGGNVLSCLNSMMADARFELVRKGKKEKVLANVRIENATALEFLMPNFNHGVPILV